jgi:branched-chain amino acid transport system substrate-binding protein
MPRRFLAVAALAATTSAAMAAGPVQGVTDTEILIGTITDLSGVTAVQGVNSADAIRLAFDAANAAGGINGRKIRYIVEDSQYQVLRAVQAMNKLLNSDRVFFTIEDGGTPMNNATYPMALEKGGTQDAAAECGALDVRAVQPTEVQSVLLLCRSDAGWC